MKIKRKDGTTVKITYDRSNVVEERFILAIIPRLLDKFNVEIGEKK